MNRFLCPPPAVLLMGRNWWANGRGNVPLAPPKLEMGITLPNNPKTAVQAEWISMSGDPWTAESLDGESQRYEDLPLAGRAIAPKLYITSSNDASRSVSAYANITVEAVPDLHQAAEVLQFASVPIKVISKPTRRKLVGKNNIDGEL